MDLEQKKIWIGNNNSLGEAAQNYAFALGWTWGNGFGGKNLKQNINFIHFTKTNGENRMFCGVNGKTDRKSFESLGKTIISLEDMGVPVQSSPTQTDLKTWVPRKGELVEVWRHDGIDSHEKSKAIDDLAIGGIYKVVDYDSKWLEGDGIKAIRLDHTGKWYALCCFKVPGSPSPVPYQIKDRRIVSQQDEPILHRGTQVRLMEYKGFPGESIYMRGSLEIGRIYKVTGYLKNYSGRAEYESAICVEGGSSWYPASAFKVEEASISRYETITMGSKITSTDEIRVGMWVTFERKISSWNSSGNAKDPKLIPDENYPFTGKVTDLPNTDGLVIDGVWGFSRGESVRRCVIKVASALDMHRLSTGGGVTVWSTMHDASGSMEAASIITGTQTVRPIPYDPANIKIGSVSKAPPRKTEFIKVEALPILSVIPLKPKIAKVVPRVTSMSIGISI